MPTPEENTHFIRELAESLGFPDCGIAAAEALKEDAGRLEDWLQNGRQAGMQYMENHREKRIDPRLLLEGARSVIVFLYNYYPGKKTDPESEYLISSYAYGADYHDVIREKMNRIIDALKKREPDIRIRGFVDSAPVLERAWATRAGLGWIGKNSMLITKRKGSWFFLSELITDLPLVYDQPFGGNYCGDCSRCMDACPTQAITDARVVDANRCISYLTIENKGEIPESFKGVYNQWIFGCDICQQVCPWNRYAEPHREASFEPSDELLAMSPAGWENLDEEKFRRLFRKSPVKRAKFEGLKRNIRFLKGDNT